MGEADIPYIVERLQDCWFFAVLLRDGTLLAIQGLEKVSSSYKETYVDLSMLVKENCSSLDKEIFGKKLSFSPTSRTTITVRLNDIMAVFELADT